MFKNAKKQLKKNLIMKSKNTNFSDMKDLFP